MFHLLRIQNTYVSKERVCAPSPPKVRPFRKLRDLEYDASRKSRSSQKYTGL
jgi:hypothetical protein